LQGGNPDALEQKVKQHYGSEDAEEDCTVQGYVNMSLLMPYLKKNSSFGILGILLVGSGYIHNKEWM
jgi:hypothetical protein